MPNRETRTRAKPNLWTIVLAGGEGKRMCPLVERWLGHERPKQYCSFYGSKSLLEYTLDRASRMVVATDRIVTIIGQGHRAYLGRSPQLPGRIVEQSASKGTGPGVFLPLSYVYAKDPDATVVIQPSDHFISPEGPFLRIIRQAAEVVDQVDDQMVLIGVPPDGPEPEYGWIEPGSKPSCHVPLETRSVINFVEKPAEAEAHHCYSCGYFWNTMIVVTKIKTLWRLGETLQPAALGQFARLRERFQAMQKGWVSEAAEPLFLAEAYANMPQFDFSRDVLTRCADKCLLVPLEGVVWSDLGRPERVVQVLSATKCRPNFPLELV